MPPSVESLLHDLVERGWHVAVYANLNKAPGFWRVRLTGRNCDSEKHNFADSDDSLASLLLRLNAWAVEWERERARGGGPGVRS